MDSSDQIQIRIFDSPPERVFGKRSEKSIFEKRFSVQKWRRTVTVRERLTEDDSINYILGNFASGDDKVQNFVYGDLSEEEW